MLALLLAPGARAAPVPQVFQIRSEIEPERPLQPGEFTWSPGEAKGESVVVADLKTQMVNAYRGEEEFDVSTIPTGGKGFETPTGVSTTLKKNFNTYQSQERALANSCATNLRNRVVPRTKKHK